MPDVPDLEKKHEILITWVNIGILFAIFGIVFGLYYLINLIASPQSYQVHFLASVSGLPAYNFPDVDMELNFSYPEELIYVNETVNVSGIAVLDTPLAQNIGEIRVGFEYAHLYPPTMDNNGMYTSGTLFLYPTSNTSILKGSAQMFWSVEGAYQARPFPIINNTPLNLGTNFSPTVHVYSRGEGINLRINQIALYVGIAIFGLGVLEARNVLIDLIKSNYINRKFAVWREKENMLIRNFQIFVKKKIIKAKPETKTTNPNVRSEIIKTAENKNNQPKP